jgi:aryl-alcohol dehydrogenase-like predicted oxidoreductase
LSCFDSEDNRERCNRASILAKEFNVTTQNIAGSWPLNQSFPSFALIGPRNIEEIDTSLPSLDISISKEQSDWLSLI